MIARFGLGVLVATPGALAALRDAGQSPADFLKRHARGDWGDLDGHDTKQNEIALRDGGRLMSSYQTTKGETVWVITEADRSSTCILLPGEY
ncbi:hypothetical protein GobsT_18180 [Gemmata obscuriglobus]|uniref:Type I restriction endonuclease subunit M n=1 Tax=Gemmata obscuriglobus TaxID=114 RepID=A0A2Z3H9Y3_9BACT|nr:hypothetical protein [Gemmata obscuriglobus]AWM39815.1 hypothetical protein C1280_24275 [Gemmata obscuriglobus]QEG27065.1 hypothetical protein GobsT_18180 [Gemmata obscuriglobus]VTS03488.1 Plasmid related protein OS=Solibacter usitatus (strain Ellin6076) GN=Acid_1609 PE=4 SV=1 [Gemmata obscuriglobus UQM 2246]